MYAPLLIESSAIYIYTQYFSHNLDSTAEVKPGVWLLLIDLTFSWFWGIFFVFFE